MKGSTFAAEVLAQLFQGQPAAVLGLSSAGTAGNLWMALHTADPTGLDQTGNELSTSIGYTRVATTRSTNGWVASGTTLPTMTLAAPATFPYVTGTGTYGATFMSIGSSSAGAGQIFYTGPLNPAFSLSMGWAPQLTTAVAISES